MENGDKIKLAKLETKVEYISSQVSNHLPTQIKDFTAENNSDHETMRELIKSVEDKIHHLDNKIAYWGGAVAVLVVVAQFLVSKFFI